jgi:hypothetical protein
MSDGWLRRGQKITPEKIAGRIKRAGKRTKIW